MKHRVQELLAAADVRIQGDRPWDIQVKDDRFYARLLSEGSLGLGDSYIDGWWECEQVDECVSKLLRARLERKVKPWRLLPSLLKAKLFNAQRKARAFDIGRKHYDLGNDLYKGMLDKRMVYTCAYWKSAISLDKAQEAKLDLVCKKIGLKKGMRVLDIGCGWGSFAKFAAENYGVTVVGISVSKEQVDLGNRLCEGLPVTLRLQDYRDVNEKFDRIVSLGMFEHVGVKNYRAYMEVAHRNLEEDGLFLLHTIGGNRSVSSIDPWIEKHIFPGAMLPSVAQVGKATEGLFVMEDWHNFGPDYDKTLMAWFKNFDKAWPKIKVHYDERFYRMWKFYLLSCAGSFRARKNQLWQVVLSKRGVLGGYRPVR